MRAPAVRLDALEPRGDALLDAVALHRSRPRGAARRRRPATSRPTALVLARKSARAASAGRTRRRERFSALRARRLRRRSSIVLASHTVQVTTEAKTSAISTAFTSGSADRYMPHGDRSRGSSAAAATGAERAKRGSGVGSGLCEGFTQRIDSKHARPHRADRRPDCARSNRSRHFDEAWRDARGTADAPLRPSRVSNPNVIL